MATIGVYDSGIGGLTTARIILDRFAGNDLYYLSDNLHHPFGNTDETELKEIVKNGISRVRAHSDVAVLACNTASSITDDNDVIKLLPPIETLREQANDTLLMATTRTLKQLGDISAFKAANTSELATLVEIQASLRCRKGDLDMNELTQYLAQRLFEFKGVKNVILGCSHYLYCKPQISRILGDVEFFDGNNELCRELEKQVTSHPEKSSKITFDFTSQRDEKKYGRMLAILMNNR